MSTQRRKVTSCMCGEQAATTTRSSPFSLMARLDGGLAGLGAGVHGVLGVDDVLEIAGARRRRPRTSTVPAMLRAAVADEDSDPHDAPPRLRTSVASAAPAAAVVARPWRAFSAALRPPPWPSSRPPCALPRPDRRRSDRTDGGRIDHVLARAASPSALKPSAMPTTCDRYRMGTLKSVPQARVDLRLAQVEVLDGTAGRRPRCASAPAATACSRILRAEPLLDLLLGHAHAGAAALGLVVPPLDVRARRPASSWSIIMGCSIVRLAGQLAPDGPAGSRSTARP